MNKLTFLLRPEQLLKLRRVRAETGAPIAELVRRAIDEYQPGRKPETGREPGSKASDGGQVEANEAVGAILDSAPESTGTSAPEDARSRPRARRWGEQSSPRAYAFSCILKGLEHEAVAQLVVQYYGQNGIGLEESRKLVADVAAFVESVELKNDAKPCIEAHARTVGRSGRELLVAEPDVSMQALGMGRDFASFGFRCVFRLVLLCGACPGQECDADDGKNGGSHGFRILDGWRLTRFLPWRHPSAPGAVPVGT